MAASHVPSRSARTARSTATSDEEALAALPDSARATIAERGLRVLWLDTAAIAKEVSSREDLIVRMQGIVLLGIFLRSTPFASATNEDELFEAIEASLRKYFGKRGEQVVQDNLTCVRRGFSEVHVIEPGTGTITEVTA